MKQMLIVMSIGSVIRLIITTGLVVALVILAVSASGSSEPAGPAGAPTPLVVVSRG